MLIALLAAAGVALLFLGIYLPRSGRDIVAERLAAFNERPQSLEEIELHQPLWAFVFGAVGVLFGWFGPDLMLRSKTQARQKQIQRGLPDALDLLVISVEAGLGFDAAIQRMVEKRDDALATEFARVLAEMRVGRSRRDALKDMVLRTQVADLNNFVGAILQAEQLGVSVTKVLSVQAEQM